MFCPNCGTKNEDDALFCASCGTRLVEDTVQNTDTISQTPEPVEASESVVTENIAPEQPAGGFDPNQAAGGFNPNQAAGNFKAPAVKMDKWMMIVIVEAVVAVLAIVMFFNIGKKTFGYESVASNYFEAMMNGDWGNAYDFLDVSESDFLNKDMFIAANKDKGITEYNTYNIDSSTESKVSADVSISYREKSSSSTSNEYISLNRQGKKNFLFFDSWKVSPDEYICESFEIQAPIGTTVTLDGIVLSDKYLNSSEGMQDFVIPAVFSGKHEINVSMEGFEGRSDTVDVYYDYDYYYVNGLSLNQETKEQVIGQAYSDLQTLVQAAIANQDFSAIEGLFSEDVKSYAKEEYNYFVRNFSSADDLCGISNITLSNVTGTYVDGSMDSGKIYSTVEMNYDYSLQNVTQNWWTGEYSTRDYSSSNNMNFYFVYDNGQWLLDSSSMPYFYY